MTTDSDATVSDTVIVYRLRDHASASALYTWLCHDGLTPSTGAEDGQTVIRLPTAQVEILHGLQRRHPAQYGNPPEVCEAMEQNQAEIALQAAVDERRRSVLTPEQVQWIEALHYATKANGSDCLALNEMLQPLCAQHFVLQWARLQADATIPPTTVLDDATDVVEDRIHTLVSGWPGIIDTQFAYDARGTTVGLRFESGAHNSLNGSYKVPLNEQTVTSLKGEVPALCQQLLSSNSTPVEPAMQSIKPRGFAP